MRMDQSHHGAGRSAVMAMRRRALASPKDPVPMTKGRRQWSKNLITDIAGIQVGHAADENLRSGVSVIVPDAPAVIAASSLGGGPGTRETDALKPETLVNEAHAVVLAGGSVYGLDAASGVTAAMGAEGRGFQTGAPKPSPIVPAAILFDVANGGDKDWGDTPPYGQLGRDAYSALSRDFALGNIGAGYGAQAGQLKGGLGSASVALGGAVKAGALMAVNPVGSVIDEAGRFWAQGHALAMDGAPEFGLPSLIGQAANASAHPMADSKLAAALTNTTIGVVAVAADLTVAEARRVAIMAHDGWRAPFVRCIHRLTVTRFLCWRQGPRNWPRRKKRARWLWPNWALWRLIV